VLFINADAEFREGRAQNYLEPEHIEKIVSAPSQASRTSQASPVGDPDDLKANDYNLNIRRYADNAPPPEPHDVRAHLLGGVPKAEIEAQSGLFEAQGFDPAILFVPRDERCFDFDPKLADKAALRARARGAEGMSRRAEALRTAFEKWWKKQSPQIAELPERKDLMALRARLISSFAESLKACAVLDRHQTVGAVARWWGESIYDLKSLMAQGCKGVVEGWVTSILNALDDSKSKTNPLGHRLVQRLLSDLIEELAKAESEVAELDSKIKGNKSDYAEEGQDESDDEAEEEAEELSPAEVKELKKSLTAARKKLKKLQSSVRERLVEAQETLEEEAAAELVLGIMKDDLWRELEQRMTVQRERVWTLVETWWDKYRTSIADLESQRDQVQYRLNKELERLGYRV
jgi:type I restriction enzyme M protein